MAPEEVRKEKVEAVSVGPQLREGYADVVSTSLSMTDVPSAGCVTQLNSSSAVGFRIDDELRWKAHLEEEGYVVIKSCASVDEVEKARSLLWDALEHTTPARRDDLSSWNSWKLDKRGFSIHGTVTQGHGAWFLRSLPNVRRTFERIWSTSELICSMDLLIVWRPWWLNASTKWLPKTEGLHIDQNPRKSGFECVQGILTLYDVTEMTGGLEVVPRTHLPAAKESLLARCEDEFRKLGDFCRIPEGFYAAEDRVLIEARAGDLILWDSRTVHGGKVGLGAVPDDTSAGPPLELARLALPICMTPRCKAASDVLKNRQSMFQDGKTSNHWPHEPRVQNQVSLGYIPIKLSPSQQALLS